MRPAALRSLFLAGGGTGGHLTPGLALLECALERFPGLEATFFRTRRGIEDRFLASSGLPLRIRELDLPAPGRSPRGILRFLFRLRAASAAARAEIRSLAPQAVVALGGYPSLPAALAARKEKVPLVLLEQNRSPGKVVRLFVRWAAATAVPDESAAASLRGPWSGGALVVPTGNPVRRAVLEAARSRAERRAREGSAGSPRRTVLVVGGSQGARGLNRAVREAIPHLAALRDRVSWIHIAGTSERDGAERAYREGGWDARVFDFRPDLPALLAGADLAIARAGGTTVAELAAIGVPSVLVPYPHHRDRHQLHNAGILAERGAAAVVDERRLEPAAFAGLLEGLLLDALRLRAMERAALAAGCPSAALDVLDLVVRIAGGS